MNKAVKEKRDDLIVELWPMAVPCLIPRTHIKDYAPSCHEHDYCSCDMKEIFARGYELGKKEGEKI